MFVKPFGDLIPDLFVRGGWIAQDDAGPYLQEFLEVSF